jgi:hypothetical protein
MKTKTAPSTVRLTPKATAALISIESKRTGVNRTIIVEEALDEAAIVPERIPVSEDDLSHAKFVYKYLNEVAISHTQGKQKDNPEAGEIALAASATARLLKRIFVEAKGRIANLKP